MKTLFTVIILGLVFTASTPVATIYKTAKSNVEFRSEAPMELIQAESEKLVGLLNTEKNTYAFQVSVITFQGFNSELQREHFNENYMESTKFPKIKFVGKIEDNVDFNNLTEKVVTLNGSLTLHGVTKERTIKTTLIKKGDLITSSTKFQVELSDHNISIPTIVNQKLAKVITIDVTTEMVPK
ncbi:MAG: YceI family protein [Salibacteraceae bacterium]